MFGIFEIRLLGHLEKPRVFWIRARPSPLNIGDAKTIEFFCYPQLIFSRQIDLFALGAIPQGGVIENYFIRHLFSPHGCRKKNPLPGRPDNGFLRIFQSHYIIIRPGRFEVPKRRISNKGTPTPAALIMTIMLLNTLSIVIYKSDLFEIRLQLILDYNTLIH